MPRIENKGRSDKTAKNGHRKRELTTEKTNAFEYYYSLGDQRKLEQVATRYNRSYRTIYSWSLKEDWVRKIQDREKSIAKKLEAKVENKIVSMKARAIRKIDNYLKTADEIMNSIYEIDPITGKKKLGIKIECAKDFERTVLSVEKLYNLRLKLQGEKETEVGGVNIIIMQNNQEIHISPAPEEVDYSEASGADE